MKCTSSVRGSTRPSTSAPFTFMVTWVFAIFDPLSQHDPENACPGLDPGWKPVFGRDHAQLKLGWAPID
jgi:hypothetical protein